MALIAATGDAVSAYAHEIPELVWSTGPVSYEYHFADRVIFDAVVLGSWSSAGTLFAADATMLAVEGDQLMGIEIGMPGNEFRERQNALGPVWQKLVTDAAIDAGDIGGVLERSEYASWLNPLVEADTYYIHALAVKPKFRGKRRPV